MLRNRFISSALLLIALIIFKEVYAKLYYSAEFCNITTLIFYPSPLRGKGVKKRKGVLDKGLPTATL
jgi:hypothetical protein